MKDQYVYKLGFTPSSIFFTLFCCMFSLIFLSLAIHIFSTSVKYIKDILEILFYILVSSVGIIIVICQIVYRSIILTKTGFILNYGVQYIHKEYLFSSVKNIRYANENDLITRKQPAYCKAKNAVAISFLNGDTLFLPVNDHVSFLANFKMKMCNF